MLEKERLTGSAEKVTPEAQTHQLARILGILGKIYWLQVSRYIRTSFASAVPGCQFFQAVVPEGSKSGFWCPYLYASREYATTGCRRVRHVILKTVYLQTRNRIETVPSAASLSSKSSCCRLSTGSRGRPGESTAVRRHHGPQKSRPHLGSALHEPHVAAESLFSSS